MPVGKPWTPEEVTQLLTLLREKKTDAEIAEAHGRTVNAIRFKSLGYACNLVLKDGKTVNEVVMDLGLSETDLQKELDKRNKVQPKVQPKAQPQAQAPPKAQAQPQVQPQVQPKKPVTVGKKSNSNLDELKDILAVVNSVQSLLNRYINNSQ